jgi:hypothetical protein
LDEEAVKEMIEKMAEFNENMGTYLQMPPEELLDPTN